MRKNKRLNRQRGSGETLDQDSQRFADVLAIVRKERRERERARVKAFSFYKTKHS